MILEPAPIKEDIYPDTFGMAQSWVNWFARLFDFSNAPSFTKLPVYSDNTSALAAGLSKGTIYRTSTGQIMAVY